MGHEVPRDAVVRVIEKNIHDDISISRTSTAGFRFSWPKYSNDRVSNQKDSGQNAEKYKAG
ncbi:MAG: hypothetical protein DMG46_00165 [Acidobacteria bacterium]|nr:MAG: hypothetical protein DMG46_00165 [Acidobacteriota bacterium]